jgi:alcohol dehydrogenase (cytochrome c)
MIWISSSNALYSGRVQRALLLSTIFLCSVLPGRSQNPLPDGNGKQIVEKTCVRCHSLETVVSKRLTREGWQATINDMVMIGASLEKADIPLVVDYLAKNFAGESKAEVFAGLKSFTPVTQEMLMNPSPDDWLMPSRTYDWQRFSPLKQINTQNVGQLSLVWAREMEDGSNEHIPLVHQGVMYVANPGNVIQALDASNGDLLWEYRHTMSEDAKKLLQTETPQNTRVIALYEDMVVFLSQDGYVVALEARTGKLRWQVQAYDYKTRGRQTSGPIIVNGKVISGRACTDDPFIATAIAQTCFIAANDARTGKELWKFYTAAGPGQPGGDTWGNTPANRRAASPWGLPGSYDPVRNLIFWGIANPNPFTRLKRHLGNIDDVPRSSPVDLFSDSTVALDPDTGKLAWYFQQLPGDDWDLDGVHERILIRTPFNPDPNSVKWINPRIPRGQERDIVVDAPEQGGIWVNDRSNGQFLWATPFPYDTPAFAVSRIDVETGKTYINWDLVAKKEGDKHTVCFENQKSWYPMSYHPGKNSLYIPYRDVCVEVQAKSDDNHGASRKVVPRPGSDPQALGGIAKVNMTTGQIQRFYSAPVIGSGATLATAGDLIFWGDDDRRFRAFDADSGKILWETILASRIESSTITYAVEGKQYVAVLTREGDLELRYVAGTKPVHNHHNTIYVFALPEQR